MWILLHFTLFERGLLLIAIICCCRMIRKLKFLLSFFMIFFLFALPLLISLLIPLIRLHVKLITMFT